MPEQTPSAIQVTQQRDEQLSQKLQRDFNSQMSLIDKQSDHDTRAASNQFKIKQNRLRDKFKGERDPAKKQALEQQMLDMWSQFEGTKQGIKDKYQPQRTKFESIRDAGVAEIQAAAAERQEVVNNLRRLETAGIITDPAVVKQAEAYLLTGEKVSLSAFRPRPNVEQRKTNIIRDIRNIDETLERFTGARTGDEFWGFSLARKARYLDPITGKERKLDPDKGDDAIIINNMRKLASKGRELRSELQGLYLQIPEFRKTLQDQEDRQNAQRQYLPSNHTEKGGSLEASLTNTISKQNKGKRIRVQSPNGQTGTVTEKELASYIAQGFKRI